MKQQIIKGIGIGISLLILIGFSFRCVRPDNSEKHIFSFENQIDQYLALEEQQGFSGVVAIRDPEHGLIYRAFGFADKDKNIRNTKSTVFDIGSLTKQFTGAAILKLEEEKLLSIQDSLYKYFPNIPEDKRKITIHQLLTHSSGLPRIIGLDLEKLRSDVFLERTFATELMFAPGVRYMHSHAGYSLLGVLIERVSGMRYEEYLSTRFFEPLGMNSTGYVMPSWDFSMIANGYRKCKNWGKPMDLNWGTAGPYWNLKANAGLLSTAEDLMIWQAALENNSILGQDQMNKFFTPHISEGENAYSFYSYGWMITESMRGTDVYAHEGGNGKFLSDWINYPQDQASVLVLSNDWRPGYRNVATELAMILFYPHHEPNVHLKRVDCYSELPDNLFGSYAAQIVSLLQSQDSSLIYGIAKDVFGTFVHNKYSQEHISGVLGSMQKDCGRISLNQIVVRDNDFMEIEAIRESDNQQIYIEITFDKEDSYKIRRMRYNSN